MPSPTPESSPPLYELFSEWQRADRATGHQALGYETYLALVEALSRGVGYTSREALFELCRVLLLKPHHDPVFFGQVFEKYTTPRLQPGASPSPASPAAGPSNKLAPNPEVASAAEAGASEANPANLLPGEATGEEPTLASLATVRVGVRFGTASAGIQAALEGTAGADWKTDADAQPFRLEGAYVPVQGRAVQQQMRALRQPETKQARSVPNLDATVQRVARQGYFDQPSYQALTRYRVALTLLIDRQESMLAFHALGDELATAARQQASEVNVYYFRNYPGAEVYASPWLTDPIRLDAWLLAHPAPTGVLILSDAGAARGGYATERLAQTQTFLQTLPPRRVAWLNPLPRLRWRNTLAETLNRPETPMFVADDAGLGQAFRWLKGG